MIGQQSAAVPWCRRSPPRAPCRSRSRPQPRCSGRSRAWAGPSCRHQTRSCRRYGYRYNIDIKPCRYCYIYAPGAGGGGQHPGSGDGPGGRDAAGAVVQHVQQVPPSQGVAAVVLIQQQSTALCRTTSQTFVTPTPTSTMVTLLTSPWMPGPELLGKLRKMLLLLLAGICSWGSAVARLAVSSSCVTLTLIVLHRGSIDNNYNSVKRL